MGTTPEKTTEILGIPPSDSFVYDDDNQVCIWESQSEIEGEIEGDEWDGPSYFSIPISSELRITYHKGKAIRYSYRNSGDNCNAFVPQAWQTFYRQEDKKNQRSSRP